MSVGGVAVVDNRHGNSQDEGVQNAGGKLTGTCETKKNTLVFMTLESWQEKTKDVVKKTVNESF